MANNNRLKAFVRYDGSGRVIPGSLNLQASKPKVGNWKEIDAYLCCNEGSLPSNCIEFIVNTTDGIGFGVSIASGDNDFTYTVTWGDGTTGEGSSLYGAAVITHDFPEVGSTYTVRFCFNNVLVISELIFFSND